MHIPCTEECSDCSSERVLVHEAKSSTKVVFHDIKWGEYQLIIGCGNDSVCSALSQWIHFPEPVSVSAHPPYSQLSETIFKLNRTIIDLKRKLAYCSANSSNLQGNVTALQKKLKNNCECAWLGLGHFVINYCRYVRAHSNPKSQWKQWKQQCYQWKQHRCGQYFHKCTD